MEEYVPDGGVDALCWWRNLIRGNGGWCVGVSRNGSETNCRPAAAKTLSRTCDLGIMMENLVKKNMENEMETTIGSSQEAYQP